MEYVTLGTSAFSISRLGFGCAAMGGYDYGRVDDGESVAAVQAALDDGVNFFDTADVYGFGHAEEILGLALGRKRHDVVIATKFGIAWDDKGRRRRDASPAWMARALDASLRRLRVDRIPLYQLHWPDGDTLPSETLDALRQSQRAGKIGVIGLCNVSARLAAEAQQYARIDAIQLPYSLIDRHCEPDLIECRSRHRMSPLTYSSLGQGLLTGKYGTTSQFAGTDVRGRSESFRGDALKAGLAAVDRIRGVGARHERSVAQVAIRWVLQTVPGSVVLTGIKRTVQAVENIGAFGWSLCEEELIALSDGPLAEGPPDSVCPNEES